MVFVTIGVRLAVVDGIGGDVGANRCELSERFHLQEPTTNKKVLSGVAPNPKHHKKNSTNRWLAIHHIKNE